MDFERDRGNPTVAQIQQNIRELSQQGKIIQNLSDEKKI